MAKVIRNGILAASLAMICLTGSLAQAAPAQQAAATKAASRPVPPVPFGFVLGKTTLAEAETIWTAENAAISGRGYAAMGAGSGVDGSAKLAADRVYLVDVKSVQLAGERPARFAFFDGVLFSIDSVLQSILDKKATNAQELSDPELLEFEAEFRRQYGPPSHSYKDLFFTKKKPNILVWDYGPHTLVLSIKSFPRSQIMYSDTALAKKAGEYKKKLCRSIPGCAGA